MLQLLLLVYAEVSTFNLQIRLAYHLGVGLISSSVGALGTLVQVSLGRFTRGEGGPATDRGHRPLLLDFSTSDNQTVTCLVYGFHYRFIAVLSRAMGEALFVNCAVGVNFTIHIFYISILLAKHQETTFRFIRLED